MEYADQPKELSDNPQTRNYMLALANGNADAFAFMWQFWSFVHCYDDLVDNDKPVTAAMAARTFVHFYSMLSYNQFYLRNKDSLYGFIVQVFNRWVDGDEWETSPDRMKRIASHVVRSGDVDLYLHVGYLCGGWDHIRKLKDAREYDSNGVEKAELKEVD